jgi:hypothetical protein
MHTLGRVEGRNREIKKKKRNKENTEIPKLKIQILFQMDL